MTIGFLGSFPPARIAVSLLFFCNGITLGAWTPMIPLFKERVGLADNELGLVILGFGIGSVASMPIVGALISKIGTRKPIIICSLLAGVALPLMAYAVNFEMAMLALIYLGIFLAGMDIAMNANVIEVERRNKQLIMSSCHGFWSVGGIVGAFFGGWSLSFLGEQGHAILWAVMFCVLVIIAFFMLETGGITKAGENKQKLRLPKSILPYMLGVVALFSVVPEGVIIDWSALYLGQDRGFSLEHAGYGFAANSAAMAIMRFYGDAIRAKFGAVRTVRACLFVAITGFLIIAYAPNNVLIIAGFFVAGLGLSNLFPIAISAAGNLPHIPSGIAVSIVTSVGYSGILLAPAFFGFIAQIWDYALIFMIMPFSLLIVLFIMAPVKYADAPQEDAETIERFE